MRRLAAPWLLSMLALHGCEAPIEHDRVWLEDDDDFTPIEAPLRPAAVHLPFLAIHGDTPRPAASGSTEAKIWSGVQVLNTSSTAASLHLDLLNHDGSLSTTLHAPNEVEAGASYTFLLNELDDDALRSGWVGAGRAWSDTPDARLEVVVNLTDGVDWSTNVADSYEGVGALRRAWRLPHLPSGAGAMTGVHIHNPRAQATSARVIVDGNVVHDVQLAPDGTQTVWLDGSASDFDDRTGRVVSDGPLAVSITSRENTPVGPRSFVAYTPPLPGASTAPLVNVQPAHGFDTHLYVQNGNVPGDLRVRYTSNDGRVCDEIVHDVAAYETIDFGWSFHPDRVRLNELGSCTDHRLALDDAFIGMAEILDAEASADGPAAVAVQINGSGRASAYASIDPQRHGADTIVLPLLQAFNGLDVPQDGDPPPFPATPGWWSGFSLMNAANTSTHVSCDYFDVDDGWVANEQFDLAAQAVIDSQQYDALYPRYRDQRRSFVGSASCKGDADAKLIAIVNQQQHWDGAPLSYVAPPGVRNTAAALEVSPHWLVDTPLRGESFYAGLPPTDATIVARIPAGRHEIRVDGQAVASSEPGESLLQTVVRRDDLAMGSHTVQLVGPSGTVITQETIEVSEPLYLVLSTDFDDTRFGQDVLDEMDKIRADHPQMVYSHFFAPYHFTDPAITDARRDEITQWVLSRSQNYGDELGVHFHGWCHFTDTVPVNCRTNETYTVGADPTGYMIHVGAYPRGEMAQILGHASAVYREHGLGTPTSFRAGAWSADADTLLALTDADYLVDSSAAPNAEQYVGQGEFWFMKFSPFYAYLVATWQGLSETAPPYWPGTQDLRVSSPSPIGVLEVPDSALMVDYLTTAQHLDILQRIAPANQALHEARMFQFGFHPNSWLHVRSGVEQPERPLLSEITDRVLDGVDQTLLAHDRGPGIWVRISDLTLEEWD